MIRTPWALYAVILVTWVLLLTDPLNLRDEPMSTPEQLMPGLLEMMVFAS